jgi:hypothetical protein
MAARDALFVPEVTSPTDARLALSGLVAAGSSGVDVRQGAFYGSTVFNITGTSNMSYNVSGGVAVISRGASTGPYLAALDGSTNVTTTAAPGSGSRYDVIYIQVNDVEQGDADSHTVLGVVQGTESGSPSEPSVPTGALRIGKALVPSGATRTDTGVTITKDVQYTAARGASILCRNQAERDAMTAHEGLRVYRADQGFDNIYQDGTWGIEGAMSWYGQDAPVKVRGGSTVSMTTSAGRTGMIDTGLGTLISVQLTNGDGNAQPFGIVSRYGSISGGSFEAKWTDGNTGNAIGSESVRTDWVAFGYL